MIFPTEGWRLVQVTLIMLGPEQSSTSKLGSEPGPRPGSRYNQFLTVI